MIHQCYAARRGAIFCECGRVIDQSALKSVGLKGFTGAASMSPRVERFLETGEPAVLKDNWPLNKPVDEMPDREKTPAPTSGYVAPAFENSPEPTLASKQGW